MNCVFYLVAVTILCLINTGSSLVRRRREFDRFKPFSRGRHPGWEGHKRFGWGGRHHVGWGGHYHFQGGHGDGYKDDSHDKHSRPQPGPNYGDIEGSSDWGGQGIGTSSETPTNNKEEQLSDCIKSCPVTSEDNPVCGSNNVTYPNPGRLECEQKCGVAVELSRLTACSSGELNKSREELVDCIRKCPLTEEYNPVCGSNNFTYVNPGQLECEQLCGIPVTLSSLSPCSTEIITTEKTISREDQISACMSTCSTTREYKPICGSDNVTYVNLGHLECAQNCGIGVTLSSISPCSATTSENTISREDQMSACMTSCPVTTEYNPVCGSDDITYANPGRLECAQNCGLPVTLRSKSPCSTITTEKSTEEQLSACMLSCPLTTEYNPVCGSDNVTYTNPGRLECVQNCGIAVTLISESPCSTITTEKIISAEEQLSACMLSCPLTTEYNPVCGSDNVTYTNPGRLECVQNCGIEVRLIRKSSCEVPLIDEEQVNDTFDFPNITNSTEESQITTSTTTSRPYVNGNRDNDSSEENNGNIDNNNNNNNNNKDNNVMRGNNENNCNPEKENVNTDDLEIEIENDGNKEFNVKGCHGGSGFHCGGHIHNKPMKKPNINELMACMQLCPLSSELNTVCGTDGISYTNPGRLLCAQFCGIDVRVKKFGHCSSTGNVFYCPTFINPAVTNPPVTNPPVTNPPVTNPPVTENPGKVTSSTDSFHACMEYCPASNVFMPVCGSNNITYKNLERLQCAIRCGVDVTLLRESDCAVPETTTYNPSSETPDASLTISTNSVQECTQQCSGGQTYEPICGTDNVTYANIYHLICVRQCGLDVRLKHTNACPSSNITTPNPSTGSNFTIPKDVLDTIWGEATSTKTPTEESEEFDIDERL